MLINLLPYRTHQANQRRNRYAISCLILAVALTMLCLIIQQALQQATQRNQQRITQQHHLTQQLHDQQTQHQCSTRRAVLSHQPSLQQHFQQQRCLTHTIPQITRLIPANITLTRLSQQANQLTLSGHSLSPSLTHALVKALNPLDALTNVELTTVSHTTHPAQFNFELHADITCMGKPT